MAELRDGHLTIADFVGIPKAVGHSLRNGHTEHSRTIPNRCFSTACWHQIHSPDLARPAPDHHELLRPSFTCWTSCSGCLPAVESTDGVGGHNKDRYDDLACASAAISFLCKKKDLDKELPASVAAESVAFCCLIDSRLSPAVRYSTWCEWNSVFQLPVCIPELPVLCTWYRMATPCTPRSCICLSYMSPHCEPEGAPAHLWRCSACCPGLLARQVHCRRVCADCGAKCRRSSATRCRGP